MAAADAYIDITSVFTPDPKLCHDCGEETQFTGQIVITQRTDPRAVIGRHRWTRCVTCEPFTDEELADEDDDQEDP